MLATDPAGDGPPPSPQPPDRAADKMADGQVLASTEERNPCPPGGTERSLTGSWRRRNGSRRSKLGNNQCGLEWAGGRGMWTVCLEKDRWGLLSASLHCHAPIRSKEPHASSCTVRSVFGWP
ncbi:hypothetical protein Y1Q_0008387 [Alligator mississippiensis]|uniref:Uncharacterized protein n=1 Tax=Alligator mississippiensis TaxID=8496 RepID=A0A151P904_ALLMI|nr:hypothetical protein Y1Q_0008387 [Alligator mississippiensis]